MSKLDLAVILTAIAGGTFWIEQDHRVIIDAPAMPAPTLVAAASCAANDTVPYERTCLDFLAVPTEPPRRLPAMAVGSPTLPRSAPCPDNDKQPYSASCLAYLKGATEVGMQWRVAEPPSPAVRPE